MSDAEREARQAANFARHLNDSYPDTALFLAHFLAGRADATTARFLSVSPTHITLEVDDSEVQLATGQQDPRTGLRLLVERTRKLLASDVPITSFEAMLAGGHSRSRH